MRRIDTRTEEQVRLDDEIRDFRHRELDQGRYPDLNQLPEHLKERMRERSAERKREAMIGLKRTIRQAEELRERDPEQADRNLELARKMGLLEGPLGVVDYGAAKKDSDET